MHILPGLFGARPKGGKGSGIELDVLRQFLVMGPQ